MRLRRPPHFDVVFYTPFIGDMLSSAGALPPGGAETQILMLSQQLSKRGLRVGVIVYGEQGQVPRELKGVQLIVRKRSQPNKRLVGKVLEAWHIALALSKAPSKALVYRCAGPELGLLGIYSWLARRRLIFSTANVVDFQLDTLVKRRRDLLLYRLGVRLSDAIVVQSEEQVELCQKVFGRPAVLIKSLSVDPATIPAESNQPQAFLWVGRLVSYKRPLDYLELARSLPEAQFWMVGVPSDGTEHGGTLTREVSKEAASVPNLELLPPRSHEEIEQLMGQAVASVNTAEFEGMPNVLLEAWSRGVPALVLRHDPNGVIREHGLGGFAAGSSERLAELGRELWAGRDARQELARRCRQYVSSYHSPDVVAAAWHNLIEPGSSPAGDAVQPGTEARCAA